MVTLYSARFCPKCSFVEKRLKDANIEYEKCEDVQLALSKGIKIVPKLEVDGKLLDFLEIIDYIDDMRENENV